MDIADARLGRGLRGCGRLGAPFMRAFRANPQAAILIGMLAIACRAFHCIVHNRSRSPLGGAHRRVMPGQIKRKREPQTSGLTFVRWLMQSATKSRSASRVGQGSVTDL